MDMNVKEEMVWELEYNQKVMKRNADIVCMSTNLQISSRFLCHSRKKKKKRKRERKKKGRGIIMFVLAAQNRLLAS